MTTRKFTPGQGLLHAPALGRPSFVCPNSLPTRKSTLEKDPMVAAIVGNYLGTGSHLFDTREFTLGSCLISTVRLGKPSPTNINLSSTRKSTVEKELMSVVDVGNSFWMAPCLLFIHQRVHTGERSFKCSRVENSLVAAHSLDIGHKGLMSTSNVGNFCGTTTDSLHTSQFMLL